MICSIHQPNFLPWWGFFDKALKTDVFVLYDIALYSKNEFHNRNKIKGSNGSFHLTVPVHAHLGQRICDVEVAKPPSFLLKSIRSCYSKALNFDLHFPELERMLSTPHERLVDYNIPLIEWVFSLVDLPPKIVRCSELSLNTALRSSEMLVEILDGVGADTYLSGNGARDYLDTQLFSESSIEILWQQFEYPVYDQLWGEYEPNLSVLDVLMNVDIKQLAASIVRQEA